MNIIQPVNYMNPPAENGQPNPYDIYRMIEWAERINDQWGQEDPLSRHAQQWIDHLKKTDEERLFQSVRRAFDLMMQAGRGANLRPPFYRGLFAYATADEQQQFELRRLLGELNTQVKNAA